MRGAAKSRSAAYRTPIILTVLLAVLLLGGLLLPQWAMFIVTIAIARGLVALGLMLLLRAGLVSFGQALYFCLGAYTAGALGRFFGLSDVMVEMLAGGAAAAAVAFALGFLLARYRGIFFGLLSLALSMILYGLLVKNEALGSTDGFNILPSTLFGVRPGPEWVRYAVMACAAVIAFLAALAVHRYLATPLGRLAPAIKDNEIRVEYMGASARYAVHVKYVIAAALAGLGGGLAATTVGHIDPEMAYWTTSGEFIFIAILAGSRSVVAPFAAALLYGVIHTTAYDLSPNTWQMTLGVALLLLIVFLPEGLFSRLKWRSS
jgi:branched-chain amino acid transport system permease protein